MRVELPAVLVLACAGVAPAALAGDSAAVVVDPAATGPGLGDVRYRAELQFGPDGYDTDEYSSRLARGERLSARIVSPFQSPLFPTLEIVGPDGATRPVEIESRGYGKRLEFVDFEIPETGRWTVRVGSILETQGKYSLTFSVRPAPPVRIDVAPDATGAAPVAADLVFDALEGSSLGLRVSAGRQTQVQVAALVDPNGRDVAGDGGPAAGSATAKKGGVALRVASLSAGDGVYRATLTADAGHGGFSAVARVLPPRRPRGTKRLAALEPWVAPVLRPLRGVHERAVRVNGLHFPVQPVPQVFFGGVAGTEVVVDPYGTYLDVLPPKLPEAVEYTVAVILADGQSSRRSNYLYYVPAPRADVFLDPKGAVVTGGSTAGGRVLRVAGANFQTGVFLNFGGSEDVIPLILSDTLIEVVTPPHAAGSVEVHLLDAYIHDVVAAVPFEYKDPPMISFAPYTPTTFNSSVATPVLLAGGNFERTDTVLFDGQPVATAWISDSRLTFTVPPSPAGPHTVAVIDRLGSVSSAPTIVVQ